MFDLFYIRDQMDFFLKPFPMKSSLSGVKCAVGLTLGLALAMFLDLEHRAKVFAVFAKTMRQPRELARRSGSIRLDQALRPSNCHISGANRKLCGWQILSLLGKGLVDTNGGAAGYRAAFCPFGA